MQEGHMVKPSANASSAARKAAGLKPAAGKGAPPAKAGGPAAKVGDRKKAARSAKGAGRAPASAPKAPGKKAPAPRAADSRTARTQRAKAAPDPLQGRLTMLQLEKSELQEMIRRLRAERDSALAEAQTAGERVRELESEQSRRMVTEPQKAGPGGFDPSVDLEEEEDTSASDEDLEEAAGFFDRMDEIRARRIELDRERNDRELEQSEQPFWLICPKCGDLMEELESENIKLERCENCGGLYLDRGEVDLLLSLTSDRDGLRRLHNALKF
jgi:uncharacterized protein